MVLRLLTMDRSRLWHHLICCYCWRLKIEDTRASSGWLHRYRPRRCIIRVDLKLPGVSSWHVTQH